MAFIGCVKPIELSRTELKSPEVEWPRWWQHSDPSIRARSVEVALRADVMTLDHVEEVWNDEALFVREQLAHHLWQVRFVDGLELGWTQELTDQESCRLALQLSQVGQRVEVLNRVGTETGQWNPFSEGSLEDRWTCAMAAQELLGVSTRIEALVDMGDYPLSMPWMLDVLHFGTDNLIQTLHAQVEWFEDGLRAPLLTILRLRDPSVQSTLLKESMAWSTEECLDAVDMIWMQQSPLDVLSDFEIVVGDDVACSEWLTYAKSGPSQDLRNVQEPLSSLVATRDDLSAAFRILSATSTLSPRQKKRVRKWVHPRLKQGLENSILPDVSDGVAIWGDVETLRILKDLRLASLDPRAQMELQIAIWRLHQQLMNSHGESDTL